MNLSNETQYDETLEWLYAQLPMFSRVGEAAYKPGLERSYHLSQYFKNPHAHFKSIHIAGTNGKGSVSNLIAATLQSEGFKTGLYTSPHLVDFRERMRINGKMIPKNKVVEFIKRWKQSDYQGERPSFFELTMMMAFDWFAQERVDYAVIEVGMGGRLDSTNIITPVLSVITNISKDHTQFLGDTLEKIAAEKGGIIKPNVPVVIGEASLSVENIFDNIAKKENAPLIKAYKMQGQELKDIPATSLKGSYQMFNTRTAHAAIDQLRNLGISISRKSEETGFANVEKLTEFLGRWTVVSQSPTLIFDTGHNEAGLKLNIEQIRELASSRRNCTLRMVIGFVADKDINNILKIMPEEATYYLTEASIPRALKYTDLENRFLTANIIKDNNRIRGFSNVRAAIETAKSEASDEDIIYIGGSTFVVAEGILGYTDNEE